MTRQRSSMMHRIIRRSFSTKKIFHDNVKIIHRNRSAKWFLENPHESKYEYLRDCTASHLMDRIQDITKEFPVVLDMGCNTGNFLATIVDDALKYEKDEIPFSPVGGIKKVIHVDPSEHMIEAAKTRNANCESKFAADYHVGCLSNCGDIIGKESVDLIISNLSLHWENDLKGCLAAAINCLKPDGVFLGAMLGGDTLFELRTALAIAEQEREGGLSPHISPMLPVADACSLLSDAGLNLSTVDTMNIEVHYDNMFECIEHLSGMGESNAIATRRHMVKKETMIAAAAIYDSMFRSPDDKITASFQIVYMIGWKPHESQPKPKARGSQDASFSSLSEHFKFTPVPER